MFFFPVQFIVFTDSNYIKVKDGHFNLVIENGLSQAFFSK